MQSISSQRQPDWPTREQVDRAMAVLHAERVHLTRTMNDFSSLNVSTLQEQAEEEKFEDAEEFNAPENRQLS